MKRLQAHTESIQNPENIGPETHYSDWLISVIDLLGCLGYAVNESDKLNLVGINVSRFRSGRFTQVTSQKNFTWPTEDSQQLKRRRYTVEKMKKEGNSLCKGKTKVFNSYLNFMSYQLTTLVKTVEGFHASIFIVNYSREQLCLFYNFCFFFLIVFFFAMIFLIVQKTRSLFQFAFVQSL